MTKDCWVHSLGTFPFSKGFFRNFIRNCRKRYSSPIELAECLELLSDCVLFRLPRRFSLLATFFGFCQFCSFVQSKTTPLLSRYCCRTGKKEGVFNVFHTIRRITKNVLFIYPPDYTFEKCQVQKRTDLSAR